MFYLPAGVREGGGKKGNGQAAEKERGELETLVPFYLLPRRLIRTSAFAPVCRRSLTVSIPEQSECPWKPEGACLLFACCQGMVIADQTKTIAARLLGLHKKKKSGFIPLSIPPPLHPSVCSVCLPALLQMCVCPSALVRSQVVELVLTLPTLRIKPACA